MMRDTPARARAPRVPSPPDRVRMSPPRSTESATRAAMQRTIDERCEEIRESLEHIRAACECAAEAARNAAGGAPEACAQLRGKVDRMCDVRREKLAQMDALKALARDYVVAGEDAEDEASEEKFDFEGYLEKKTKYYLTQRAKDMEYVIAFDKAASGGETTMGEDEDLILDENATATVKNAKCPISAKRIEDIDDPVEDLMGFVYERVRIEEYIGRAASKECPVMGTSHRVSKKDLKPSRNAIRMKQRAQGRITSSELISP